MNKKFTRFSSAGCSDLDKSKTKINTNIMHVGPKTDSLLLIKLFKCGSAKLKVELITLTAFHMTKTTPSCSGC